MTDIHCALLTSDDIMASECGQHSHVTLLSLVNLWTCLPLVLCLLVGTIPDQGLSLAGPV